MPLFDTGDKVINLIAHNELDDTYPAVRVGRLMQIAMVIAFQTHI